MGTLGFEVVADNQAGPMRWLQVAPTVAATGLVLGAMPLPGRLPGQKDQELATTTANFALKPGNACP